MKKTHILVLVAGLIALYLFACQAWPSKEVVRSSRSSVYHVPTCKWARKINNRYKVTYPSSWDASAEGNRPCEICRHLMTDLPSNRGGRGGVPTSGPWHQKDDEIFKDVDD